MDRSWLHFKKLKPGKSLLIVGAFLTLAILSGHAYLLAPPGKLSYVPDSQHVVAIANRPYLGDGSFAPSRSTLVLQNRVVEKFLKEGRKSFQWDDSSVEFSSVNGMILEDDGRITFWKLLGPKRLRLCNEKNEECFLYLNEDIAPETVALSSGKFDLPAADDIARSSFLPNEDFPRRSRITLTELKGLIGAPEKITWPDPEGVKQAIRAGGFDFQNRVKDAVSEGVLLTKQMRVLFWTVVENGDLLLFDERGCVCLFTSRK